MGFKRPLVRFQSPRPEKRPVSQVSFFKVRPCLRLQVDARRGQNDPRKPVKLPVSMARSRCKSCRPKDERVSSGETRFLGANAPAGVCGVKDRVRRMDRENQESCFFAEVVRKSRIFLLVNTVSQNLRV